MPSAWPPQWVMRGRVTLSGPQLWEMAPFSGTCSIKDAAVHRA